LCENRSVRAGDELEEGNVREYQLILDEDNIPVTIKCGIFICKPCRVYILLRSNKTIPITRECHTYITATIIRYWLCFIDNKISI